MPRDLIGLLGESFRSVFVRAHPSSYRPCIVDGRARHMIGVSVRGCTVHSARCYVGYVIHAQNK
jgi:hypothetical protein